MPIYSNLKKRWEAGEISDDVYVGLVEDLEKAQAGSAQPLAPAPTAPTVAPDPALARRFGVMDTPAPKPSQGEFTSAPPSNPVMPERPMTNQAFGLHPRKVIPTEAEIETEMVQRRKGAIPQEEMKNPTDFKVFYAGMKKANPGISDLEISKAWDKRKDSGGASSKALSTQYVDAKTGRPIVRDQATGRHYAAEVEEGITPAIRQTSNDLAFNSMAADIGGSLKRIKTYLEKNGNDSIGPYDARVGNLQKKGLLPGLDEGQAQFYADVASLSDTELRRRSGAAITEPEMQRVLGFTMDPKDSQGAFLEELARFEQAYNTMLKARQAAREGRMQPELDEQEYPGATTPQRRSTDVLDAELDAALNRVRGVR